MSRRDLVQSFTRQTATYDRFNWSMRPLIAFNTFPTPFRHLDVCGHIVEAGA